MSDDLVELRARYTGSGSVMVCRHPDVEDLDANHEDRRCVLDLDRQDDCDIAMHYRHERKEQCACWQAMHRIAPVQPTAEEALALLDRIESLTTEIAALKERLREANRAMVTAVLPLEAINISSADMHCPEVREGIRDGISAVRTFLQENPDA